MKKEQKVVNSIQWYAFLFGRQEVMTAQLKPKEGTMQ